MEQDKADSALSLSKLEHVNTELRNVVGFDEPWSVLIPIRF